jgi:hypothetical protein
MAWQQKIDIELCLNLWYNRNINQHVASSQPSSQLQLATEGGMDA